ncbi:MAG: LytTR family DNA-binding domain-containing protein [Pseudomonadota bacterium]
MDIRAVIIDDEPLAIDALRRLCERIRTVRVLGHAGDGAAGLSALASHRPDVVFLDIGMPGMSGLELAATIKDWERPPLVVLVTAFDHYATEAFDLCVVDYLLKPVESLRFERAIERVGQILSARQGTASPDAAIEDFWAPHAGSIVRIPVATVQRIDAERDYVRLTVDSRSYLLRAALSAVAARLDPALFVRVHRSTIVRADCVGHVRHLGSGAWEIVDRNGRPARVGRSYLADVKARLGLALPT